MSLYQMMNGVNPAAFFILPMLGEKHPDQYPRFRDCFVQKRQWDLLPDGMPAMKVSEGSEEPQDIYVYTRVGGGNRDDYQQEIKELQDHPNYLTDFDDDFDCTYATFVFSVPDEWKDDYQKAIAGNLDQLSAPYQERLRKVFPKLKDSFDKIFNP